MIATCPMCQQPTQLLFAPLRDICHQDDHHFVSCYKYNIFKLKINNDIIGHSIQPNHYYFNSISIPDFKIEDIYSVFLKYVKLKPFC